MSLLAVPTSSSVLPSYASDCSKGEFCWYEIVALPTIVPWSTSTVAKYKRLRGAEGGVAISVVNRCAVGFQA